MRQDEQELEVVGNTVRNTYRNQRSVCAALVVGNTLTSHYWLNILPMARNPALRQYILEEDLGANSRLLASRARRPLRWMIGKLHVFPEIVPAFLVFHHGYVVDWFPAPLPPPGGVQDPLALLRQVQRQLETYQ